MEFKRLTTKEKALKINLNPTIYGSLAEIGAGQDVASNFFKAGGASGTIAKTMSAYDMAFSDAIYGPEPSGRYVCQSRVERMLDKEFGLLGERLPQRAPTTRFFSFANTVEQINFNRTNQGHGWLGVRFQLTPESQPNECLVHVQLKDNDPIIQQETLGILGVNLIFACYYYHEDIEMFINSLIDDLSVHKVLVNYIRLTGPDFLDIDNRLLCLKLVKNGLSKVTMFGPDGKVQLPSDHLYKKNIMVLRGRFRPITHVNVDMMEQAYQAFKDEPDVEESNIVTIAELSLSNLRVSQNRRKDEADFLDRVDLLCSLGYTVMISNYSEYYKLTNFLSRYTRGKKIGVALGVYNLQYIFNEEYYKNLKGGILEAFGYLFGRNIKLFVYPSYLRGKDGGRILTSMDINVDEKLKHLFLSITDNDKVADITRYRKDYLHIISDNVLDLIKASDPEWEKMVPELVAEAIKRDCLFDFPCSLEQRSNLDNQRIAANRIRQQEIMASKS